MPASDFTKKQQPRTDSIEIYPAGRGKILAITKKSMPPKTKRHRDPSYVLSCIKSNPDNIALIEYLTRDKIKRVYLFPEGRQLDFDERLKLASALIVSLSRYLDKSESNKVAPHFFTRELRGRLLKDWRRYKNWRRKQK